MPLRRPEKRQKPKLNVGSRHPSAYIGTRLVPTLSLEPANLLQLQKTVGNSFVAGLLSEQWKVVRTARRDKLEVRPGSKSEELMEEHPRYGDWRYQFVVDSDTQRTVMYWITLNNYKNRQRHVLINPDTLEPLEVLGSDLSSSEKKSLLEWAMLMFYEQMSGNLQKDKKPARPTHSPASEEEEQDMAAEAPPDDDVPS